MAPGNLAACADPPVVILHHSELALTRRVEPVWPSEAAQSEDQRCLVTVRISQAGRPLHARAEGCRAPFGRAAEAAVAEWRWEPPLAHCDGPLQVQTTVALSSRLGPP